MGDRIAAQSQRLLIALRAGQRGRWNPRSNAIRQLRLNEGTVLVMLPLPFANPLAEKELLLVDAVLKAAVAVVVVMENACGYLTDIASGVH